MIILPEFDPVFLNLGFVSIRWYGLMYVLGFMIARYIGRNVRVKTYDSMQRTLTNDEWVDLLSSLATGVIFGGRIGYIIFYQLSYFYQNPFRIFAIWEGGMSFHGAFLGFVLALFVFSRVKKIDIFSLFDLAALSSPPGLAFGRLGNFINGELWGRVSSVPWAMVFPHSDLLPRHPSQIYELMGEGFFLYLLIAYHAKKNDRSEGSLGAWFVIHYAWIRFMIEFFREPDHGVGYVIFDIFTMGQVLCFCMFFIGLLCLFGMNKRKERLTYQSDLVNNA